MLSRAEPRTIQAVLSCGTKNCGSVTKAMEHFQPVHPTAGAEVAQDYLRRLGDCFSGCAAAGEFETQDPKSKPEGIPLASLSGCEARGVLDIGSGRRGQRSEMSDVLAFRMKDVIDMDLDGLIQKYNRTLRAAGLLRYMLEADHGVTVEPEHKTWSLVQQLEFQEFQAWKRHKVWCFLRYARDTRRLFDCPWRPTCLFFAFQTFRVLSLVLAPGTKTVFTAFTMYSMLQAMVRGTIVFSHPSLATSKSPHQGLKVLHVG